MGWSTKNFRDILDQYTKLYKEEKDPFLKEKYLKYISNLRYEIAVEELTLFERKKYGDEKEMEVSIDDRDVTLDLENGTCFGELTHNIYDVSRFDMYYPLIEEFRDKLNNLLKIKEYEFKADSKLSLTNDEIVEVIHDMFKDTTKEIFDLYLQFEKNKDECLRFDPTMSADDGSSFSFPIVNKRFIEVGTDGPSENSLGTLSHELGHYISSMFNEDRYLDDSFVEIESLFFELVGLDYFYRTFDNEFFKESMKDKVYDYYNGAKSIIAMKDVNIETFEKMDKVKDPYEYFKFLVDNNIDYKDLDFPEKIKYLIGYITAVELFEIYKQDKKLAIDVLKRMVNKEDNKTMYNKLVDNIDLNKNIDKHVKRLEL